MATQSNLKLIVVVTATFIVTVVAWKEVEKPINKNSAELNRIVQALDEASKQSDKFAAADQFEKLTALKYKYQDEKNMPCLQAVMTLTSAADEVNTTGFWSNKEDSISTINQCKG